MSLKVEYRGLCKAPRVILSDVLIKRLTMKRYKTGRGSKFRGQREMEGVREMGIPQVCASVCLSVRLSKLQVPLTLTNADSFVKTKILRDKERSG